MAEPLLSQYVRRFREQELKVKLLEQNKAGARLAIKTWALEFEAVHGLAPSAEDKRSVIDKYAAHYEVIYRASLILKYAILFFTIVYARPE